MSSKEDLKNFQLQLDQVNDGLSLAPDDQDLLDLKAELTDLIGLLKEQLKSEEAEQEAQQRKWQQKKQRTIQPPIKTDSAIPPSDASTQSPEPPPPPPNSEPEHVVVKVGDVVSAKWAAGD